MRGVFENPEEVAKFDCDGTDCYDNNSDYPIPLDMIQMITSGIVQGELGLLSSTMSDEVLNRKQDMTTPPRGQ